MKKWNELSRLQKRAIVLAVLGVGSAILNAFVDVELPDGHLGSIADLVLMFL